MIIWQPMDTLEKNILEKLWNENKAPWKNWINISLSKFHTLEFKPLIFIISYSKAKIAIKWSTIVKNYLDHHPNETS